MGSIDRNIVEACIEDGNLLKLLRLPDSLEDFSEASIIKSLEFIIKCEEHNIESATAEVSELTLAQNTPWIKETIKSPLSERRCYALNVMLCQKFSPQFLQEETKAMTFDCVLVLAKYLHLLLSWSPAIPEESPCLPSLEQVIDWLNALLDSHFQQLRLAEDANEVISSLTNQITLMTQCQSDTKALLGTLAELNRQFEEQQRNNKKVGDYCIEVISF